MQRYDIITDAYLTLASSNYAHKHFGSAIDSSNLLIYVFGCQGPSNIVEEYSVQTNSWRVLNPMLGARQDNRAVRVGSRVFVSGDWNSPLSNTMEFYDIETQQWSWAPNMLQKLWDHVMMAHNSSIYVFAGSEWLNSLDTLEIFSIEQNQWMPSDATLLTARTYAAASCVVASKTAGESSPFFS